MKKNKRSIYQRIHYNLIQKNNQVDQKYQAFYSAHNGNKFLSIPYALLLNMRYCLFSKKNKKNTVEITNNNKYPEQKNYSRDSVEKLTQILNKYDYISFDIFDTLIFRRMDRPKALFYLIGQKLNILDFYRIRIEAERDARKMSSNPYGEIDINDIYELIANRCGIDKEQGIQAEIETELDMCFPNPYMKTIFDSLLKNGKRLLLVSNMYLNKKYIEKILESCGYEGYQHLYVSCDCGVPKHQGELFKMVEKLEGKGKYIHIGDNFQADFEGARIAGWKSYYYKNVNQIGNPYRPSNMSKIMGSVYSGIVNSKLHNGLTEMNPYYEFGYVYGGVMACGFCDWINQMAKEDAVDYLVFAARDMKIVHEVYNKFYREYDNEYVLMSRYSALRFAYERVSEYFAWAHIKSRANQKELTIIQALTEVGLDFLENNIKNSEVNAEDILSLENYDDLKLFLDSQKEYIIKYFEEETEAAKEYYLPFFKNKRVAIVDLGWQGTNALALKYFMEEKYKANTTIYSYLLAAAGNMHLLNPYIENGITRACAFSPLHNLDLFKQHTTGGEIRRMTMEIMFTSSELSLRNFKKDKKSGEIAFEYMPKEENRENIIANIHAGIMEFAHDYNQIRKKYTQLCFSPTEMYQPVNKLMYKTDYLRDLFADFEINPWIGNNTNTDENKFSKYTNTGK